MRYLLTGVCALGLVSSATGQTFTSPGAFAIEVSLENSSLPRLPIYQNAITSLEVTGDFVIGGTSAVNGLSPYLFAASLSKREIEAVYPLDRTVKGQRSMPGGFGRGSDGWLYAGTLPQSTGESGHLIRVAVKGKELVVEDLGSPVEGEGVLTVIADPKGQMLYGLSYPAGRFFSFCVKERRVKLYDATAPDKNALRDLSAYSLKPEEYLSRRLVMDRKGRVYGSYPLGGLFRFDPASEKIDIRKDVLPSVSGHRGLARADAWAVAANGTIYGSNAADGQLFTLDPDTGKVVNLGKPAMMARMRGLAFVQDGTLYGVSGGERDYAHVFTYRASDGFVDLGNPLCVMVAPGIEQGIPWRGFRIASVAASDDGRYIVMGEDEALSQLIVIPARGEQVAK